MNQPPLTDEEKMNVYRIARNFQSNPKKVVDMLIEEVGDDRLQLAIDYLNEVINK